MLLMMCLNVPHSESRVLYRLQHCSLQTVVIQDPLGVALSFLCVFSFYGDYLQWKKYWFVLTDHSLRYYKDSIAEEVSS